MRFATGLILQKQLLPFAQTPLGQQLIGALSDGNQKKFPSYRNELLGTAEGSSVPFHDILLLNFRKEILPLIPKTEETSKEYDKNDDCSDIVVVSDSMAVAADNEEVNVALVGRTYLIKGTPRKGMCFTAYTHAGELPSCASGFNNHGLVYFDHL